MVDRNIKIFILVLLISACLYNCSESVYNSSLRVQKIPVFSKDSLSIDDTTYYFLSAIDSNVFINDTFFLLREEFLDYFGYYFLHETYIAPDNQKQYKKSIKKTEYKPIEKYYFDFSSEEFNYPPDYFQHFNTYGLSDHYIEVYPYGGQLYLYNELNRIILTDSIVYYGYMMGFYPRIIKSFEKISKNQYTMIIQDFPDKYQNAVDIDTVNIYVFKDVSLWDYGKSGTKDYYEIFTNKKRVNKFDVIYNSCEMMRTFYIFDYPPIDSMKNLLKLR